jgi:hypothetical protein
MTELATIGHNRGPDPIDKITAAYEAEREEAANWLDGSPVENEAQMNAVDALRKAMRQWRLDLERGQKSASAPLHDAWKAVLARWKPTIDDAKRIEDCLVSAVNRFKQRLAEEKRAAERAAWEAAEKARREADAKARAANAADLEAQREAAAAKEAAMEAEKAAQAASRDQVKGLRTVKETVVLDQVALARYLWQNDRDALVEWQTERARKLGLNIPGVVEIRMSKEAY